jgi:(p)ppGpp synthase/HD superfamily hydrolase
MNPTNLGSKFQSAMNFAFTLHQEQRRKSADIPYFSYLMGVAAIVLEYGGDETTAVAALLHDAVEDQGGQPTDLLIERVFGIEVATLVRACTEDKALPWQERKQQYIDHMAHESAPARLICAADKIHNLRAMLTHLQIRGNVVWTRFKGGRDKSLWFYEGVLNALRQGTQESDPPQLSRAVDELERTVRELSTFVGIPATADKSRYYGIRWLDTELR